MSDFTGPDEYQRNFDPKVYLKTYFSVDGDTMENALLLFNLKHLAKIFNSGKVGGDTLIDIGTGPSIYHLLPACEVFKNIICTDLTDRNREELKTWLSNQPGAFDWSPVVKYVCQLEGDRVKWSEKEVCLKKAIKQVLKCDVMKSNPTAPVVLPQADCILSCLCLEVACKDREAYVTALNNITTLLKPGGYLVLTGALGSTYYEVGELKFSALVLTETLIRESLSRCGCVVESFESSGERDEPWLDTAEMSAYYVLLAQKKVQT